MKGGGALGPALGDNHLVSSSVNPSRYCGESLVHFHSKKLMVPKPVKPFSWSGNECI